MEDYDISPIQSDFEQIKKLNKNGQEYWPSRDLCTALGYSTFEKVFVCHKWYTPIRGRPLYPIGYNSSFYFNIIPEMV